MNFFDRIKQGLTKTREDITNKFTSFLNSFTKVDEEFFEELEDILISCDIGIETSEELCNKLRERIKEKGLTDNNEIKESLKEIIEEIISADTSLNLNTKPSVILVLGVNGVGKTTTIGKIAYSLSKSGKKVMLAAADTFRAAAIEQLMVWAERSNCPIVKQKEGSDPAAVVFDAISSAKSKDIDVVICDTAGRLHNKSNLMGELEKINRIIDRELPNCDKEVLLVLDATTGQNGLNQALEFKKYVDLTGVVLTKLDGTAKGGIVISIKNKLGLPVKYIGIGENIEDLQEFDAKTFVNAIFDFEGGK